MTHRITPHHIFSFSLSLQCCVFTPSERGLRYGLHTTIVYGFYNQQQIMESCLHPQLLGASPEAGGLCVRARVWLRVLCVVP